MFDNILFALWIGLWMVVAYGMGRRSMRSAYVLIATDAGEVNEVVVVSTVAESIYWREVLQEIYGCAHVVMASVAVDDIPFVLQDYERKG